jgi:iron complex transport system permease protein
LNKISPNLQEIRSRLAASRRAFVLGIVLLTIVSVLSVLGATGIGRLEIPWGTVIAAIGEGLGLSPTGSVERTPLVVVFDIRLSRVILSFLMGAALGIAGSVFQGVLRNPLADPFTIGVASGAAFGAALAFALGWGGTSYLGPGGYAWPGTRTFTKGHFGAGRDSGSNFSFCPHRLDQISG